jgi:uncharacterized membrane protein
MIRPLVFRPSSFVIGRQPDTYFRRRVLVTRADTDKVLDELQPFQGHVVYTTIKPEAEQALRKALESGA